MDDIKIKPIKKVKKVKELVKKETFTSSDLRSSKLGLDSESDKKIINRVKQ